jgi:hypothetical protein
MEPLNARLAEFLVRYNKEDMLAITLGPAPIETERCRLWAMVLYQGGRRMILTGREASEMTKEQTALAGLLAALAWEQTNAKMADSVQLAPGTITYPEEAERVLNAVKAGRWHTLPPEIELIGAQITNLCDSWERNVTFAMLSYDKARQLDPTVDSWILPAENTAKSTHPFISEDNPELPKETGHMPKTEAKCQRDIGQGLHDDGRIEDRRKAREPVRLRHRR